MASWERTKCHAFRITSSRRQYPVFQRLSRMPFFPGHLRNFPTFEIQESLNFLFESPRSPFVAQQSRWWFTLNNSNCTLHAWVEVFKEHRCAYWRTVVMAACAHCVARALRATRVQRAHSNGGTSSADERSRHVKVVGTRRRFFVVWCSTFGII